MISAKIAAEWNRLAAWNPMDPILEMMPQVAMQVEAVLIADVVAVIPPVHQCK